jgi:hypothetical protein
MTIKDKIRKKSSDNILLNLDQKKPYFGIPYAYCQWYLADPSREQNVALTMFYEQMLSIGVKHEVAKITIKQTKVIATDTFNKQRDAIEKKVIPAELMKDLTPAEIERSRKAGLVIGVVIAIIALYIIFRKYLP